ncbi:hypothetical protein [Enterobacter pasteurii]
MLRLMGDGYEPYVDKLDDRLIYSLPVESGFLSFNFEFVICQVDLDVLLSDHYRRAVLEVTAHTLLQRSTLKGHDHITQHNFDELVFNTLHTTQEQLQEFISKFNREYHILIEHYVNEIVIQRTARG